MAVARGKWYRIGSRVGIGLVIALGCAFVATVGTVMFGQVTGQEFAPDTFERRRYRYYELPVLRIKVSPVKRRVESSNLTHLLVGGRYVVKRTPPQRWDLVFSFRDGRMWQEGDARVLCQYLDASTDDEEGKSTWSAWTTENEPLARVLWPEVARLARGDLYLLIPPLMQVATAARDAGALRRDLNGLLARSYERLADTERELGHWETAIRFYTATLEYDPGRVSALRGRAMCYDSVGKTSAAAGDRKQAGERPGERRA